MQRAVQGYGRKGEPIGLPGDRQTHYDLADTTGQMFSSARELAAFLAANPDEMPIDPRFGWRRMGKLNQELVADFVCVLLAPIDEEHEAKRLPRNAADIMHPVDARPHL
jgi:hypothetical protein